MIVATGLYTDFDAVSVQKETALSIIQYNYLN